MKFFLSAIFECFLPDTLSVTHDSDDDVNTVHFKMNSCCLKARNVQVQVGVLNHRVQVRQKPDSSPTRVQVQDSSPTTLIRGPKMLTCVCRELQLSKDSGYG